MAGISSRRAGVAPGSSAPPAVDTAMDATTVATIAERGLREDALGQRLSQNQKDVNTAHARQRGPGERANGQLKS
jgi:hypothetical protein